MRALVTGGAGFIGSNLVDRLLAEDHQIDVVDDLSSGSLANLSDARRSPNGRMTFHQFDVRSDGLPGLMSRCRPEVVYHLAASGSAATDQVAGAELDLLGSLRVLEGARASGARKVVFATTAFVYGPLDPGELPVKESHPLRPATMPAVAKKAVGDYLQYYRDAHSLEFSALALGHVYGPRRVSGVVAAFARALAGGEAAVVDGRGRATRDFVFVDDVVDALARAATRGGGLLINVGTGIETSVADLYRLVCAVAGEERPAGSGPERPDDLLRMALDPGRAAIHLGWKPWTTLEDGVASVLEWARSFG